MDIHRPKPWHGLREFLKEFATIVLGVLVALGAEQTVEALHRDNEVREARQALREELGEDMWLVAMGMEEDKCLLAQLPAYAAWARGGPKPPAFRTLLPEFGMSTWDTVKAGAVPHMPLRERLAMASAYDQLANEQKVIDIQRSSSLVLFGAHERAALDAADAGRVLDAVATETQITNFHMINGAGLLKGAAEMGIKPPPLPPAARAQIGRLCGQAAPSPAPGEPGAKGAAARSGQPPHTGPTSP